MLDVLIDNIFVLLGGQVFQQTIGIPMDTNCALRYSPICFICLWGMLLSRASQE